MISLYCIATFSPSQPNTIMLLHAELCQLKFKFDVLCFTQSWLTADSQDLFKFNCYNSFHSLRPAGERGGGVSVYVRDSFDVKEISACTVSSRDFESLVLEVDHGSYKVIVGIVYRPSRASHGLFIEKLSEVIAFACAASCSNVVLCGDFNYDTIQYVNNSYVQIFFDTASSYSLVPLIDKPTRITDTSRSIIDNIFVLDPYNCKSGIILSDVSDHLPVFLICPEDVPWWFRATHDHVLAILIES